MAFYSFGRIKIISRSKKKTAVATAAYHSATKITNEYDGVVHDHTNKKNVGQTYIRMPEGVPAAWVDESVPAKERLGLIWNTVEKENTNKDSRLARQFYLALQNDWSLEENLACVNKWVAENCTKIGMGITYTVHNMPGNLHVDVMALCQQYDENGKKKQRKNKEYFCRKEDGTEAYLDAEAFKISSGYEKVYRYKSADGTEFRLTKSEAEKRGDVTRINKNPVSRVISKDGFDRQNLAKEWRKSWEEIINAKIVEKGLEDFEKVDCRSYADQGSWKLPTGHVGWEHGERAAKQIADNEEVADYNNRMGALIDQTLDAIDDLEEQLDELNSGIEMDVALFKEHKNRYENNKKILEAACKSEVFGNLRETFKDLFWDLKKNIEKIFKDLEELFTSIKKGQKQEKEQIDLDFSEAKKATSTLANLIKNAEVVKSKQAESARSKTRKNDLEI